MSVCACVQARAHIYVPTMAALSGYCMRCRGQGGVREDWTRTLVPKAGPWMDALAA